MNARVAWFATIAVQALLLGWIVAREESTRRDGARVVLEVRAVDPMDLFSGRYVRVPLAISSIDLAELPQVPPFPKFDDTVYVRLERGPSAWHPVEIALAPTADDGGPWARATVVSYSGSDESPGVLRLDFGADRFYIPENGLDPSMWWRDPAHERPKLTVAARIAHDGRVAIEDLLIDGESYAEWNRRTPR